MAIIEKLVYGGDGLARVDGKVEFIPFSLPGEEWNDGALVQPSADRIDPECPYFAKCGGCHYQHFSYERQLAAKKEILIETLARLGKITPPEVNVVAGEAWGYRNRAQFHFDRGHIGFHAAGSQRLVAVNRCPISSPGINRALEALREMRRDQRFPRFIRSLELFTNETETLLNVLGTDKPLSKWFFDWAAERIPGATLSGLDYAVGTESFHVSHKSFFQVNRFLIEPLVDLATRGESGKWAVDLYAGVGLFSRPLRRTFDRVTAVEVVRSAAMDLAHNVPQCDGVQRSTEDFLATLEGHPDFILADPPRAGLGARATGHLVRIRAPRLTIVSCDPATLARDLAVLTQEAYAIESMTLVDLFPQTYHLETVTRLVLR